MGIRFDKAISISDIAVIISAAMAILFTYTDLKREAAETRLELGYTNTAVAAVSTDLRTHKIESTQSDQLIKSEVRDSLRDINAKLDRLVERELDRNGR